MRALLVDDFRDPQLDLASLLAKSGFSPTLLSMQKAIETLEAPSPGVDCCVCRYGGGSALWKAFVELSRALPTILVHENAPGAFRDFPRAAPLLEIRPSDPNSFANALAEFHGRADEVYLPDSEFLRTSAGKIKLSHPIFVDVYSKIAPGHYRRHRKKSEGFTARDLRAFFLEPRIEDFYVLKTQAEELVRDRARELEAELEQELPREKAQEVAAESLEIVHSVVSQIGFTPRVQELAKKTVALVLRTIGKNPALRQILQHLEVNDGQYISAHSLMLAEVACAVAYRVGWASGSVFTKLTLASFLHDISLDSQKLGRIRFLDGMTAANGYTDEEREKVRLHPVRAAELAKSLSDLPADVDTIVAQHHEQPDGSGFPRGLYAHQISPLSCLFIVSHDLLDFHLQHGSLNPNVPTLDLFLSYKSKAYSSGNFAGVRESLQSGVAFMGEKSGK